MTRKYSGIGILALILGACSRTPITPPRVPALEYSKALGRPVVGLTEEPRARIQFAEVASNPAVEVIPTEAATMETTILSSSGEAEGVARVIEPPPYRGPLRDGESSSNPSLWRDGEGATSIFHDFRAFQPMDLVTVLVTEVTEGRKQADTTVKSQSSITGAISALLGLEKSVPKANPEIDPTALLDASTQTQIKGQGETLRRGQLRGTISCMVQEVLPSGILRVQGEKIISVNDEEQIMVLSGLVRPRDVNSRNEVDSAKIANMRIDYYGKGTIGIIQSPGWLMEIVQKLWPF